MHGGTLRIVVAATVYITLGGLSIALGADPGEDARDGAPAAGSPEKSLLGGPRVEVDWPAGDRPGMMMTRPEKDGENAEPETPRYTPRRFDGRRRGRGASGNAARDDSPIGEPIRRALREVGLSDEQAKAIRAGVQAFNKQMNEWRAEHKEELESLRTRMQAARRAEDREQLRELMAKARELRKEAPKPAELAKQIEAVLTPEQAAKVKELRRKYAQEQGEGAMQRGRNRPGGDNERPRGNRGRPQLDL